MANSIFRIDLSHGARDYEHLATEPGLPMLDTQSVNHAILSAWFGDLVAEPQWETEETIAFFVRDGERGRLDQLECAPATRADMERTLKDDIQRMQTRLRKIKPRSSTEKLLLEIVKKNFQKQTSNLDDSDFDSFFFKVREKKAPWRLVWCWGYQRTDLQPSPAYICSQPDCQHLFVRRPKTRPVCPLCDRASTRKPGWLGTSVPVGAILAVVLLLLILMLFFPRRLRVEPGEWTGPAGSRVVFRVHRTKWFFWKDDVTHQVVVQSHDSRIIEFDGPATEAKAKNQGQTSVSFLLDDLASTIPVVVGPSAQPDSLVLEPASVRLAVGATQRLRAMGVYQEGPRVDVSDLVEWSSDAYEKIGMSAGVIEGKAVGTAKVTVRYPTPTGEDVIETSVDVDVVEVDFKSLLVKLSPESFGVGQASRVEIFGLDGEGESYSLSGSTGISVSVDSPETATLEGEYLLGKTAGTGECQVKWHELEARQAFSVTEDGAIDGVFAVTPKALEMLMYETFDLNIANGTGNSVETVSSDSAVVEVMGEYQLAGRSAGNAVVTVTCGDRTETINVTVHEVEISGIRFDPEVVSLRVGDRRLLRVYAITKTGRAIELVADQLQWLSQPLSEFVDLERTTLRVTGLRPTPRAMDLEVRFQEEFTALASVEVTGTADAELAGLEAEAWLAHPPVGGIGRVLVAGPLVGAGLRLNGNRVIVGGDVSPFSPIGSIPSGAEIIRVNGDDLTTLDVDGVGSYFESHPLVNGDVIEYRDLQGNVGSVLLGGTLGAIQDFKVLGFQPQNVTPEDFSIDLKIFVRLAGKYRLSNEAGDGLSSWEEVGENRTVTFSVADMSRNDGDDYELYLDREIDSVIKRFQITFKLDKSKSE